MCSTATPQGGVVTPSVSTSDDALPSKNGLFHYDSNVAAVGARSSSAPPVIAPAQTVEEGPSIEALSRRKYNSRETQDVGKTVAEYVALRAAYKRAANNSLNTENRTTDKIFRSSRAGN